MEEMSDENMVKEVRHSFGNSRADVAGSSAYIPGGWRMKKLRAVQLEKNCVIECYREEMKSHFRNGRKGLSITYG